MTSLSSTTKQFSWRTPIIVIIAGCLIAMFGFGVRSVFGLFLEPMSVAKGWNREVFALAMAIQYLLWGFSVPVAGAISDKYGPVWVLIGGSLMYAIGTWGMAVSDSNSTLYLTGGVLIGLGLGFTSFTIALASMAKVVSPQRRTLILGIGTAAGSLGQVLFSPLGLVLIQSYGWQIALYVFAAMVLIIVPLALFMPNDTEGAGEIEMNQSLREALAEALHHRGFVLLTIGFFVCGFHVAFITVHFPSYVKDLGFSASIGAYTLAIVGVCNIVGSFVAGAVGERFSKHYSLSFIYFGRAIVIAVFMLVPKTEFTIYSFAVAMGFLWLATVPLTTGIVAQVFGVRYMTTLVGIVFVSHQIGSFTGIWLGGRIFDTTGSYDAMWWAGVVLAILAGLIHMPINEKPLPRLQAAQ